LKAGHIQVPQPAERFEHRLECAIGWNAILLKQGLEKVHCALESAPADSGLVHDFRIVGLLEQIQVGAEISECLAQQGLDSFPVRR